jgi:hypothetical protein
MERSDETYQCLRRTGKVITGEAIILDRILLDIILYYDNKKNDYFNCKRRLNVETVELSVAQVARLTGAPNPPSFEAWPLRVCSWYFLVLKIGTGLVSIG